MHCSLISTLYLMIYLLCFFTSDTAQCILLLQCSIALHWPIKIRCIVFLIIAIKLLLLFYFQSSTPDFSFIFVSYFWFFFFFLSHFISKSVFVPRTHTLQSNTHLYSYFLNGFELCFAFEIFSYRSKFAWNESSVLVDKRVSVKYLICCLRTKYDMRIFLDRYIICLELDF